MRELTIKYLRNDKRNITYLSEITGISYFKLYRFLKKGKALPEEERAILNKFLNYKVKPMTTIIYYIVTDDKISLNISELITSEDFQAWWDETNPRESENIQSIKIAISTAFNIEFIDVQLWGENDPVWMNLRITGDLSDEDIANEIKEALKKEGYNIEIEKI